MNDLYYNKYLKYKQKYLDLKHGGQGHYIPPHLRNYYIDIKNVKPVYFKDNLALKLNENKFKSTDKDKAAIVFLFDYDKYPQRKKDELEWNFKRRRDLYQNQFRNIKWINSLWGNFKDKIINKVTFHEYFKDKLDLQKYIIPWNIIRNENKDEDISKIIFKDTELKILKASNGYYGYGTVIVNNELDARNNINKYEKEPLVYYEHNGQKLFAKDWIIEDLIQQDKIEGRPFFLRVHILVISKLIEAKKVLNVYISNKQPYLVQTKDCKDGYLSQKCIDNTVGAHLEKKYLGGGIGAYIDVFGNEVMYDFNSNPVFPKYLPDTYNNEDIDDVNKQMNDLFSKIFNKENISKLKPEFNSPNGFEIFGCDVSLVNKKVKLHEINNRTGLLLQAPFIEDIVKIVSNNEESIMNFNNLN